MHGHDNDYTGVLGRGMIVYIVLPVGLLLCIPLVCHICNNRATDFRPRRPEIPAVGPQYFHAATHGAAWDASGAPEVARQVPPEHASADEIAKLHALLDTGAIDKDEFERAKAGVVAKMTNSAAYDNDTSFNKEYYDNDSESDYSDFGAEDEGPNNTARAALQALASAGVVLSKQQQEVLSGGGGGGGGIAKTNPFEATGERQAAPPRLYAKQIHRADIKAHKKIGAGQFGEVWLAEQAMHGKKKKPVMRAVKTLKAAAASATDRAEFVREA